MPTPSPIMVASVGPLDGWRPRTRAARRRPGPPEPDHGGDDRQPHRDQAAQHQGQDDHRGDDADDLADLGVVLGQRGADRARGGRRDAGLGGGRGGVHDLLGQLGRRSPEPMSSSTGAKAVWPSFDSSPAV